MKTEPLQKSFGVEISGVDLRDLFLSCTSVKQFWSARDPGLRDYISKISGEVNYSSASWAQFKSRVNNGELGRQFAAPMPEEEPYIHISESSGPRLTSQDLEDHSREPNTSIVTIERNAGMCCFQGAFPLHTDWVMPASVYEHRKLELPWPEATEETIVAKGIWPSMKSTWEPNEGDADAEEEATDTDHASQTEEITDVVKKLDALKPRKRHKGK